jgi:hypothetical protein
MTSPWLQQICHQADRLLPVENHRERRSPAPVFRNDARANRQVVYRVGEDSSRALMRQAAI